MSEHQNQLAMRREQQLATMRAGTEERFTLDFACVRDDIAFRVTFARIPPSRKFCCEKVEREGVAPSGFRRLQGMLRPKPKGKPQVIPAEQMDFSGVTCAGCGHKHLWTYCSDCGAMICGFGRSPSFFHCRKSCGSSGPTSPAKEISASTDASVRAAIGHSALKALPKRGRS